jgi:hypothetical protein
MVILEAAAERTDDVNLISRIDRLRDAGRKLTLHKKFDVRPDSILLVYDPEAQSRVSIVKMHQNLSQCRAGRLYLGLSAGVRIERRGNKDPHQGTVAVVTE